MVRFGIQIEQAVGSVHIGSSCILCSFGVASIMGKMERLNYNAWYGAAAYTLIDTTIEELESGNEQAVIRELKTMREQYHPTYENKAHFDELADETAERMRAK